MHCQGFIIPPRKDDSTSLTLKKVGIDINVSKTV